MSEAGANAGNGPAVQARSGRRRRIIVWSVIATMASVAVILGAGYASYSYARSQVEAVAERGMTYGDMVFLEGWSVGIYFRAADSVVRLIRYYYIIGDGRVMMRLGETGMMVRVDGTAEAADGTSSSH